MQIKRSYELERKGLSLNPYLFEAEANLIKRTQKSKTTNYQHLYQELQAKANRRLDKPSQLAEHYVLARIFKYVMLKAGLIEGLDEAFEKDYYSFIAMYQQRLDPQKQEEILSICQQIQAHRATILASEQQPDVLEQNGFSYSESTFDDLFARGFREGFVSVQSDESEEREEEAFEEEQKAPAPTPHGVNT